jgi:hypothetical protein
MASTTFIDQQTIIYADWLNDVNNAVYNGVFAASSISPSNLICNGSVSGTGFTGLVNNTLSAPGPIGSATPNTGAFTTLTASTPIGAASGGTGRSTLTANNVLLGNGTSAVQQIAPGTSGNILTSNGTTWASTAPVIATSAWVYYDGSIIANNNVASVTNPSTGLYLITFTTAFANANYIAIGTGQSGSGTTQGIMGVDNVSTAKTAGAVQVIRARTDNGAVENGPFYFYFFSA